MASRKRDLRSGRSIWQARRLPHIPRSTLTRDVTTDVVVVGAGISGALVSEMLSESGLAVCVLDRRGPTLGSTSASTALLQYELDTPLSHLVDRVGQDRAERIWRRSYLALRALADRAARLGIDAGIEARSSLYLSGNVLGAEGLKEEAKARSRAGFDVGYLTASALADRTGIEGRSALVNAGNLVADPRRLTAGFLATAAERGTRIFVDAEVTAVEPGRRGVLARTAAGPVVRATHLIYATGYEVPEGVSLKGHRLVSTWALATHPQSLKRWPSDHLIWEASDPYLYLRAGPEGRVICGGEDEEFSDARTRDALLPSKVEKLRSRLARLLPRVDSTPEFAWTGTFGASDQGTPTIGAVPGSPGCHAVLGYGGNGITFSMMGAQILRGLIVGDGDPDQDLFAFE